MAYDEGLAERIRERLGTRIFDMTGRPMRGWVVVAGSTVAEDEVLGEWIDEGHAFAASLPPK
ncbi:hypothetical protein [Streptomyces avermitilis]|uniref:hypothetical protein n=1 Tax=Streptomyces avermitilis TaxID=33903 RepID=UPI00143E0F02|nr:hypothetical protein [Streptomyces sp. S1D4-11]QIY99252.1 hypothetical protein HEP87_41675 [Streptomyces sp. S1D4-11]